jgi:hypothetical protein
MDGGMPLGDGPLGGAGGSGAAPRQRSDVGARLARVLSAAHGLQQLDIQLNTVPASTWVRQLPRLLAPFASTLRGLSLAVPGLTTADGAALSEILANPDCRLETFQLRATASPLSSQAALALTEGLRSNAGLRCLRLAGVAPPEQHTVAREAAEAAHGTQRSVLREIIVNEQSFRPNEL